MMPYEVMQLYETRWNCMILYEIMQLYEIISYDMKLYEIMQLDETIWNYAAMCNNMNKMKIWNYAAAIILPNDATQR